ncbi:retention module-containing protein [Cellvibrio sp. QJXJ]|uniref:retention module-containing protein n=1 Tax=Cellvibrio sp. QJXJ TaxID=2964606 RepID=UPI0021C380B7|nr:retention module-containing protein [Cellvibrio sp. QJXJ]UUA74144.1 retention module-containing protein [Cellvibrio sp. QJXJ]
MSNAVATVAFLQGQAWAKSPDGSLRPLTVGAVLNDNEILVTAEGARVELDIGGVEALVINGGQEVAMSRDMNPQSATSADEALLDDASVQQVLAALEQEGDLLEELEETAAGDNSATGGGSSSFVRLDRIAEATNDQDFDYGISGQAEIAQVVTDGEYVNRAPQIADQLFSTDEDTLLTGQIIATDVEGDLLTYTLATPPANGTLQLDPVTGQFTFTPNANYNGADSFVVTVTDSSGNSSTATISLNIAPVNDAPVSADQTLTVDEDTQLSGQIVASDIEGDALSYTVTTNPVNGTLTLNPATGSFIYTPNANYNGSDSFVVTISDGNGGATTSTVTIGVTPVNDAPTASNLNLTTNEDVAVPGQIVASDLDGDTLAYAISGLPANGSVTLNPATGSFIYTPNANYNGSDSFVVTISDGNGGTTTSTVTIGVTPQNDAPTASNLNLTTNEDVAVPGQIVANDLDGDTLAYAVTGVPTNGVVTLNPATGSFIYTPNANYNGSDSFVVTISDGNGGTTTSTVTIGVTPVNDAPTASNLNLTTNEDVAVPGQIVASDLDGDTLAYAVSGLPTNGSVTLNPATGSFIYTPNANYNGSDSFVVTISDGNGGTTTSTVTIGVTPQNDAPTASNLNLTTNEDVAVPGQIVASDLDGDTLAYAVTGVPTNGVVTLNPATGSFVYTPNANYNGSDSFVVTISDGNGGTTTSTVTIGVTPQNDAPTASNLNLTTNEDVAVPGQIIASDLDGDTLAYAVTGVPTNGVVTLNPATGSFIYTPNANYNGSDSFVVTISDGNGGTTTSTVTIGVTPVNDAPVTVADSITVNEGGTATLLESGASSVLANDSDAENSPLSAILVSGPAHGTLMLNANGTFSYTHNGSETTSDSFTYRANDGTSNGNIVTVQIAITPVNDAPTAVNDTANVDEGSSVAVAVRTNDSDPEGGILSVVSVSQGANGSVVIDAVTGNPIYTPSAGFSGNDSFTYTVQDPLGATATATVNVVVKANAPSVLVQDLDSGPEDNDVTGNVLTNDTDADDTLTVASFQVSGLGSFTAGQTAVIAGVGNLVLNANGSYVFEPEANWHGAVPQVTYTTNTGSSSTLDITVTPVNDAPVAVDDFYTINEDEAWSMPLPASGLVTNDSDPDGDSLRVVILENAVNGTLSVVSGNLVFTPTAEFSGTASFDYRITDDKGGVDKGTVFINVVAVDDPTQAIDDVKTVAEGSNAIGNVLTNDVDPDTTPQVASFVINGTAYNANESVNLTGVGTFTLLANGDYTFVPADINFNGAVPTVTYTTDTGASADLNITLTPVNDAPVAVDDTFTITVNTTLSLPMPLSILVANDTDVDNDTLRVTTVTSEANGTLQVVGGNLVFTPTPGFTGVASFTYIVTDDKGGVDSGRVNINVVAAPNQAPETNTLNVSGDEDTLITINLAGSDSDGSVAGYVIKSLPANGLLYSDAAMTTLIAVDDLVSGPVYFKPDANWNGSSQFDYSARDDKGLDDSTPATVNISVNPVADAAVVGSGAGTVKEDTPAQSTAAGTLSITDPDAGEEGFEVQSNTAGTYGSFSITSTGDWTYNIDNSKANVQQLKEGEIKTETFTVKSIDGTTSSVVITVTGTNDGPTAVADTGTTPRNTALTFTPAELLGNDTDPDGDTLTIDSVQGAVNGNVDFVAGNVVFTPTAGYSGPASFTYTVNDGQGGTSTAQVNINVTAVNTPPDAVNDNPVGGGTATGLHSEYFGYRQGTDGSNLASLEQVKAYIDGRVPSATFTATTLNYNPGNSFDSNLGAGTNLQTFLGSDAASLSADPATTSDAIIRMSGFIELDAGTYNFRVLGDDGYQIKIDGVTVAEVAANQSATTRVHPTFTIATGGIHTIEIVYWDQGYYARFTAELSDDGGMTYQPFNSFNSYKTANLVATEDTPFTITAATLLANDSDANNDGLTLHSVQGAVNGSVKIVDGNAVFIPNANYVGPASFTYTISDGRGGFDTASVNLVVSPVNDAPVAVNDNLVAASNSTLTITPTSLRANDIDVDGDILQIVEVDNAVNGTAIINGAGNILFTPTLGFEGSASFTYTARDNGGITTTATVNLAVGSASAPSVVVSKSLVVVAQGTGGTSVKFPITTKLVDTDGSETLSIKVSGVPTGLSFNAGTNLGGGVWQFAAADLPNLMLNLPGSYSTNSTSLTVQVTSTEANGGFTASTTSVVNLKAAYTTVDVTTTESGNFTGSSASEHIQGGAGNNTINAGNGSNVVRGGAGDDNLSAGTGTDIIYGGSGNDVINSGNGNDRLIGGAGNDTMSGGNSGENFVDIFAWSLGDQGTAGSPAVDTIQNFSTSAAGSNGTGGDVLDLRDLLQGESVGASNSAGNLTDYLHFEVTGGSTIVHISHTGGYAGGGFDSAQTSQQIVLSGVDLQSLYSGATTDQQIITQLLNNNKLITD